MTLDFNLSAGGATYVNLSYDNSNNQNQNQNNHHANPSNQNANATVNPNANPQQLHSQHQQQLALQHHHHHPQYQQPGQPYAYAANMTNTRNWVDMSSPEQKTSSPQSQSSSPHSQSSSLQHSPFQSNTSPLTSWTLHQQQQQVQAAAMAATEHHSHQHRQYQQHSHHDQNMPATDMSQFIPDPLMGFNTFSNMPAASFEYLPPTTTQTALAEASLLQPAFSMPQMTDATHAMQWGHAGMHDWDGFNQALHFGDGITRMNGSLGSTSPTQSLLEVVSLNSSHGDGGWGLVNFGNPFAQNQENVFNPSETLHLRTNSDSSEGKISDMSSFEEIPAWGQSPFSPGSDGNGSDHRNCYSSDGHHHHAHDNAGSSSAPHQSLPVPIKVEPISAATRHSPGSGAGSSPSSNHSRRNSGPKKSPTSRSPIAKSTKSTTRRISNGKKDGAIEKKVGRRKGPLLPEQRKQASEIRKLRACLRCKFLKKTCDKGEPCTGCQPSHARLWQVPCTRIDIKDIGYFLKDWKADYDRHLNYGVSVYNVKGFAQKESLMWITHGYGFALPVMVRQVYVADDSCFNVDWVESHLTDQEPIDFETRTEKLDVGAEGVSIPALEEYLNNHIDGPFEEFIDDHFEGTPFITEILKTAHRFYTKQKMPVIKKALKLVLAYNLTLHITMVENQGHETDMEGQIDDEDSKFYGRTVAPVMINFQIKCALADMWRELQKDILEELSSLYSGVYSGEKMKNWPTIFMLASILLAVWEEMQFDCHYRVPDQAAVNKFCSDMETTPVGVIVGLFHAISQKLPAFTEWDTRKHGHLLHNNEAVCDAITEVRQHVLKHEQYLRSRKEEAQFDRYDFDSLSNKFVSKLVIRAN